MIKTYFLFKTVSGIMYIIYILRRKNPIKYFEIIERISIDTASMALAQFLRRLKYDPILSFNSILCLN